MAISIETGTWMQSSRPMFHPSDHLSLKTSLLTCPQEPRLMVTVGLFHCGRLFQPALVLPWDSGGILVPGIFEIICNPTAHYQAHFWDSLLIPCPSSASSFTPATLPASPTVESPQIVLLTPVSRPTLPGNWRKHRNQWEQQPRLHHEPVSQVTRRKSFC